MRVVIGYDASTGAQTALGLVRALAWPAGTHLRFVQVVQLVGDTSFAGSVAGMPSGVIVDTRVIHDGDVAGALVATARELAADLQRPLLAGAAAALSEDARATRDEAESAAHASYQRLAVEVSAELRVAGLNATADVRSGDPAEQLIAAAREIEADLIVLGTRGRGSVARALLGSVARAVLLSAPCAVLVVREKA